MRNDPGRVSRKARRARKVPSPETGARAAWPEEFARLFAASFGEAAWEAMQSAYRSGSVARGLRANPLKPMPAGLLALAGETVPWEPCGRILPPLRTPADRPRREETAGLGRDPLHAAGGFYLQEPSAMAPAAALRAAPGERVLDLCAAPGGKTTQIAGDLARTGLLFANEVHRVRVEALAENVERMGVANACLTHLQPGELAEILPGFFDAILVDAPCSGEGMFRKDPEAVAQWSPEAPLPNALRQLEILDAACRMLRPGGRLVYSTCTFNPLENEAVAANISRTHPEMRLFPLSLPGSAPGLGPAELADAASRWPDLQEFLGRSFPPTPDAPGEPPHTEETRRYFPFSSPGEGHFIALFRKILPLGDEPAIGDESATRGGSASRIEAIGREEGAAARLAVPSAARFSRVRKAVRRAVSADPRTLEAFREFSQTALTPDCRERFETEYELASYGASLYAVHPDVARLLRSGRLPHGVLRPGLPLLQSGPPALPAHALALTLTENDARQSVRLSYGSPQVLDYLRGEELASEGPDGYCLVTVEGLSLGWGRRSKNRLKNLYPKGLRRHAEYTLSSLSPYPVIAQKTDP